MPRQFLTKAPSEQPIKALLTSARGKVELSLRWTSTSAISSFPAKRSFGPDHSAASSVR